MRTKYFDVQFPSGKLETNITGIYMYDYGIVLRVMGLGTSSLYQAQFAIDNDKRTANATCQFKQGQLYIKVPTQVLEVQSRVVRCYIYYEDAASGYTCNVINIAVIPRPKPSNSQYTDEQHTKFDALSAQLTSLIEEINETKENVLLAENKADEAIDRANEVINNLQQQMDQLDSLDFKVEDGHLIIVKGSEQIDTGKIPGAFKGQYVASDDYYEGQIVIKDGDIYMATSDTNGQTPSKDATSWTCISQGQNYATDQDIQDMVGTVVPVYTQDTLPQYATNTDIQEMVNNG